MLNVMGASHHVLDWIMNCRSHSEVRVTSHFIGERCGIELHLG